jgi:hypothetical protein
MEDFPVAAPTREQFHELWVRMARFATRHPQALQFLELHHHGDYLDRRSRAVESALMEPLHQFILAAQKRRQLRPMAPELLGTLVWGAFMGLVGAERKGMVELTPRTLEAAEASLWEAVRRA